MRLAVNKITEQARTRDTLGRNKVEVVCVDNDTLIQALFDAQNRVSSDNVEKVTNLVILDKKDCRAYLLKYRLLTIESASVMCNHFKDRGASDAEVAETREIEDERSDE